MKLTFLGTSSGTPTRDRNVTGLAVQPAQGSAWDLFDCGEGTQHQLLRTGLALGNLRRIFITHLHGDHCFGLFGLLGTRAMAGTESPLHLFGPPGLEQMVRTVLKLSASHLCYDLSFSEIPTAGGSMLDDCDNTVVALPLVHRVDSYGWLLKEAPTSGTFDVARAKELGVPPGPLFGQLKAGQSVTLADGAVVEAHAVVGPEKPGQTLLVGGDNTDPVGMLERSGKVDCLVHEATYAANCEEKATRVGHCTTVRLATAAQVAGVGNLIMTHFSPRYGLSSQSDSGRTETMADLELEASQVFKGPLFLAEDFDQYELLGGKLARVSIPPA